MIFGSALVGAYINERYESLQMHRAAVQCADDAGKVFGDTSDVFATPDDRFMRGYQLYSRCLLITGIDPRTVPAFGELFAITEEESYVPDQTREEIPLEGAVIDQE